LIDGYKHNHANVFKHVHGSTHDKDPNNVQRKGQQDIHDTMKDPKPTTSTSQALVKTKMNKLTTHEALTMKDEQVVMLTNTKKDLEVAKLNFLQGILAKMNELM